MKTDQPDNQGVGVSVLRKEDERLLRGAGRFVGDISMHGLREVAFVRSPIAHGDIRTVRKPAEHDAAVFVRSDLVGLRSVQANLKLPGFKVSDYPPLATGKVRFVGEAVAMCVAETRARAEDIADLVRLEIDERPAVVDALVARQGGPLVHDEWNDNLFLKTDMDKGISEAAAHAAVIVRREYRTARQVMNPLEGKAVLAHWDERADQLVVYTSTQIPHMIRSAIAEHLNIPQGRVRVVAPDVGGAFGYKCVLQPEELCIAWLASKFRRPFRWIEDRREHLISGANCREHFYTLTAYANDRGKILGVDADITVDAGAYSVWPFTSCLEGTMAGRHLPGPYNFGAYRARTFSVATNKPPIVPYRGVARTGISFAMELTVDAVARAVGREPWEVRRENLVSKDQMPFTTVTGNVYDSGDYQKSLDLAVDDIDIAAIRDQQKQASESARLIGVGFANYIEMTAHGTALFAAAGYPFIPGLEQASVRFTPDGDLEVRVGVHSHGQGMETSLAQLAHEVLGVPVDRIAVILGDTALTPFSTGTYASRSITMAGGAVVQACRILKERLSLIAAHLLQCPTDEVTLRNGTFFGKSGDISVRDVATVWYMSPQRLPNGVDAGGMEVTSGYKPKVDSGQYSYGTHGVVVEVDRNLGTVQIMDYVITEDCGRRVNPMIVDGQTIGGAAQGIGTALLEEMPFDANGQPLGSTLADYLLPSAAEIPPIRIKHMETPSPNTEFGIKGVGEGGAIPPPAAIFNAVNDALRPLNAELTETPLSPRRVLAAIAKGAASAS